jgi:hypothetical protein
MVPMSHMMVPTSHMIITTITFGTLNFYLLFKFNIYKKSGITNITYDGIN